MNEYTLVQDGNGWGVLYDGVLVNETPMTKEVAKKLIRECKIERKNYMDYAPSSGNYNDVMFGS